MNRNRTNNSEKLLSMGLGILQIFVGVGAIPAGISMIADPSGAGLGMSVAWLEQSPFADFLIPGIVLLLVNGIGSLTGSVFSLRRMPGAGKIAIGLGAFLTLWIIIQAWWLGLHWLQVLFFVVGAAELAMGIRLSFQIAKR